MAEYAVQVGFNEQYENESGEIALRPRVLVFEAVEDTTINASNQITEHPIVSGDMVSDHSYKMPQTMTISGMASINGNQGVLVDSNGTTLANLEELFMTLKNEAYLCEIVKVCLNNEKDVRFTRRSSMVLQNIQLTEKINTLQFTLTFRQVLTVEVQTLDVDVDDAFLPNLTEPQTSSFTDALIDWTQVDLAVISQLIDLKLITDKFLQYLGTLGVAAIIAICGAAVAISAFTLTATATAITAALTNPVGLIVGAVIAVGALVAGIVIIIADFAKTAKYRIKQFKYYAQDKKNNKEVQRFTNFMGEIHHEIELLNDLITVYQIGTDESQECMLTIDNNYYIFTFTKNNTSGKYKCVVTDINNSIRSTRQDVFASPINYNFCTSSNALFRVDETGSYVHLINMNEGNQSSLKNVFVVISKFNPSEYTQKLTQIIKNSLTA